MPSTPPWMLSRRATTFCPERPSTSTDGLAAAISTSSIVMSVPESIRMIAVVALVALPRTIERVTVTWLALMVKKPWMSCASIRVPSLVTTTSWATVVSATPAGTPVFVASGFAPGHGCAPASPPAAPSPAAPSPPVPSREAASRDASSTWGTSVAASTSAAASGGAAPAAASGELVEVEPQAATSPATAPALTIP